MCALTEFHALAGFRDPHRTIELLRCLDAPELAGYAELLVAQPDSAGLRALFTTWITLPQLTLDALLPSLLDACVLHVKEHGPFEVECKTVLELGEAYPGDAGVLAALLLNRFVLQPGEAIYLPAGNLHAYLSGTAVEIMANSDNVLRGGLTPKHVDVPELLRVLDFSAGDVPVLRGERHREHVTTYHTPAEEFLLSTVAWPAGDSAPVELAEGRPQIVLCTDGAVHVSLAGQAQTRLGRGGSLWLPASDPVATLRPEDGESAQVFVATPGGTPFNT